MIIRLLAAAPVMLLLLPDIAGAQLVSQEVREDRRICTYVGSDALPDGQLVPRTAVTGAGQECPAIAPYRNPNAGAPRNAMLVGERTGTATRTCIYAEGGLEYPITVGIARRCAATPALLERAQGEGGQRLR